MDDSIVSNVVKEFQERSKKGFQKYGVTLDRDDLSLIDWLQHLKEEMMDAVNYVEKTIQILKSERDSSTKAED